MSDDQQQHIQHHAEMVSQLEEDLQESKTNVEELEKTNRDLETR